MRQAQIFISYRRDDAAGYARAVHEALAQEFGAERVFIDVDDIGAGQAFGDVIRRAVGDCEVLLILIGKRWLGERTGMPPRIDDSGDFVRIEVASALANGMRVIPLLLDGAVMPSASQLPDDLRSLAGRNALEISNTRFDGDVRRLVAALRQSIVEAPALPTRRIGVKAWGAAAAIASVAAVAWWQLRAPPTVGGAEQTAAASGATAAVARPDVNGEWRAEVDYDWPNSHHSERFGLAGEAAELRGTASFLGLRRDIRDGSVQPGGVRFVTRTSETAGAGADAGADVQTVHRYAGRLVGGEIHFVMQTEGGSTPHVAVEFIARRVEPAASRAGR